MGRFVVSHKSDWVRCRDLKQILEVDPAPPPVQGHDLDPDTANPELVLSGRPEELQAA